MSMKLPAWMFYPGDHLKDPGIRALDFFHVGVWLTLQMFMFESEERGVLLLNGKPAPDGALGRMLGLDNQTLTTALTTLLTIGVASRRESDGAIFSRRMVRDERIRQIRAAAGKLGGNPALLNQKQTTKLKQKTTLSSPVSSSVSSSVSFGEGKESTAPLAVIEFGEFKNCRLTQDQYASLKSRLNGNLDNYIEKFDRWIEEQKDPKTGKLPQKYRKKQAYLSIPNWFAKDREAGGDSKERTTKRGDPFYVPKQ